MPVLTQQGDLCSESSILATRLKVEVVGMNDLDFAPLFRY
jgi:hypothetical protein